MTDDRIQIQIYQGRKRFRQAWRWHALASNGRIIATGAEAYTNHDDIRKVVDELFGDTDHLIVDPHA